MSDMPRYKRAETEPAVIYLPYDTGKLDGYVRDAMRCADELGKVGLAFGNLKELIDQYAFVHFIKGVRGRTSHAIVDQCGKLHREAGYLERKFYGIETEEDELQESFEEEWKDKRFIRRLKEMGLELLLLDKRHLSEARKKKIIKKGRRKSVDDISYAFDVPCGNRFSRKIWQAYDPSFLSRAFSRIFCR
jgi:hypothetical protein